MKSILVLTETFHPDNNGRAERLYARLKRFPSFGWKPIVVIPGDGLSRSIIEVDNGEMIVYRPSKNQSDSDNNRSPVLLSKIKSIYHSVSFPDNHMIKIPEIRSSVDYVISKENIGHMYTMCYPFTFHLLGRYLKWKYNLKWLAEFRDPWVTNPYHFDGEANFLHKFFEKNIVHNCDILVYNYGIQVPDHYFRNIYAIPEEKVLKLDCPGSCGFDFDKYDHIDNQPTEEFRLTYAGAFYGESHTPEKFLEGFRLFLDKIHRNNIILDFYGDWRDEFDTMVSSRNLEKYVNTHNWVPHKKAFQAMKKSHILVSIIRPYPGDELNVPSKLIDYIAANRPILNIVKEDWEAAHYIKKHGVGLNADPEDPNEIKEKLIELYDQWKNGEQKKYTASEELLNKIDVNYQTERICRTLDSS